MSASKWSREDVALLTLIRRCGEKGYAYSKDERARMLAFVNAGLVWLSLPEFAEGDLARITCDGAKALHRIEQGLAEMAK